jgi:hypothetical protein
MVELSMPRGPTAYQAWFQIVTSMLECQWKLLQVQHQVGLKMMKGVLAMPAVAVCSPCEGQAVSATAKEAQRLERLGTERVQQGLAPPRELYALPYRDHIDWSRFPEWARPSDPELFEDCVHEG